MRVNIESFEHWYANQIKYKKVDGTPPGEALRAYSYSVAEIAELLGISDDIAYSLLKRFHIETFKVDTWMRIRKDVFETWYNSQSKYRTKEDRERDAELEKASMTLPQMARLLGISRNEVYQIVGQKRISQLFANVCRKIRTANGSVPTATETEIAACKEFCTNLNVNIEQIFRSIEASAIGTDSEAAIKESKSKICD